MMLTFTELAAYQQTPDAQGKTLEEQIAAATAQKAALLAAQAQPEPAIDWAAHVATLQAERAEFEALGNAERVAEYDQLIAAAEANIV